MVKVGIPMIKQLLIALIALSLILVPIVAFAKSGGGGRGGSGGGGGRSFSGGYGGRSFSGGSARSFSGSSRSFSSSSFGSTRGSSSFAMPSRSFGSSGRSSLGSSGYYGSRSFGSRGMVAQAPPSNFSRGSSGFSRSFGERSTPRSFGQSSTPRSFSTPRAFDSGFPRVSPGSSTRGQAPYSLYRGNSRSMTTTPPATGSAAQPRFGPRAPVNRDTVAQLPSTPGGSKATGPTRSGSIGRTPFTMRSVPPATFRGADTRPTTSLGSPRQTQRNLAGWVRDNNVRTGKVNVGRVGVDTAGRNLPDGVRDLRLGDNRNVGDNFRRMERDLGTPNNKYAFRPRRGGHGEHGDRDRHGDRDGRKFHDRDGHRGHHGHDHDDDDFFAISFFYPFYFASPFIGYDYGYYQSPYDYWGWTPAYIYPERAYYSPPTYDYGVSYPVDSGPSLDLAGVANTLSDIRQAWANANINQLASHLTDQTDVQIFFDNNYSYTTSTKDFYAMTADAMSTVKTVSLTFDKPVWVAPNEVFVTGRQVFIDPEGEQNTVHLSYRLRQIGDNWYIVASGSSRNPIQPPASGLANY